MTSTKEEARRRGFALALICVAQFMVVLDFSIVNVALPSMQRDLGFSTQSLQWVVSAYSLTLGGFLMLGGRLSDLYGRRLLFIFGLSLFSLASLAGGLAPTGTFLIIARAIQGVGAALVAPAVLSLITTTFAEGPERNRAFGIVEALVSVAFAAGAILGGLLTAGPGWRWVMFVNVPIGVVAVVVTPFVLRESRIQVAERHVDVWGALTVTAGLVALVYSLSEGNDAGWLSLQTLGLLVLAAILLGAFVLIEARTPSPLLRLGIFRQRTVTGANLVNLLLPGVVGVLIFVLTLYMQKVRDYSAIATGLAFVPIAVVTLILSNIIPRLVARRGFKFFIVWGMVVLAIGSLMLAQIGVDGNYLTALLPGILVSSLGMGPAFATVVIAGTEGVSDDEQGLASGLFNTTQQVGSGLVLAIALAISSAHTATVLQSGTAVGKAATVAGLQYALYVCAGVALLAALIAFFVIREKKSTTIPPASSLAENERDQHPIIISQRSS